MILRVGGGSRKACPRDTSKQRRKAANKWNSNVSSNTVCDWYAQHSMRTIDGAIYVNYGTPSSKYKKFEGMPGSESDTFMCQNTLKNKRNPKPANGKFWIILCLREWRDRTNKNWSLAQRSLWLLKKGGFFWLLGVMSKRTTQRLT